MSTSKSTRCRSNNPARCRHHGVSAVAVEGDFTAYQKAREAISFEPLDHLEGATTPLPAPASNITDVYEEEYNTGEIFSELEIIAFTQGDCWALAEQVHKLTGWPIVAIGSTEDEHLPAGKRDWSHLLVKTPDGSYLDVEGVGSKDQIMRRWSRPYVYGSSYDMTDMFTVGEEDYSQIIEGQNNLDWGDEADPVVVAQVLVDHYKAQSLPQTPDSIR